MARSALNCPACGTAAPDASASCERCGADLSLLRQLDGLADSWFNRGLRAAAQGDDGLALEWISACCVVRPNDAEARLVQAKLWARFRCLTEARNAVGKARELDPERVDIEEVERAIDDLSKPKGRRTSRSKRKSKTKAKSRAKRKKRGAVAPV